MQKQFLQPFAMWEHLVRIILRYRLLILLVVLSITVFMGYKGTQVHLSYEMAQMLPESDPVYEQYEEFKKTFGEDGNVVFLGVDDPRFFELENFRVWYEVMQDLKTIEGVTGVLSITNIPQIVRDDENKKFVLEQVMKHKPESQQELDSLVEIVYSLRFYDKLLFNKEMGSVLAAVSVDRSLLNTKDRVYLINNLHERADVFQEETGIDLHYSGLPFIRTTIAEKIESELQLFIFLALIIAAMLLYLFFRGIRAVIFPVFIVIISVIWAFGLIVILGYEITVLTGILPPLLIIIGVENSIFLLNKYHHEFRIHQNKTKALTRMVQRVGKATMLTNATTAVGFATFIITGNTILVEFGIVAALNILFIFILTLLLIPIFFSYTNPPALKDTNHLDNQFLRNIIKRVVNTVVFKRSRVYAVFSVLFVVGILGILQLKSSGNVVDDVPQRDQLYKDLLFFEKNINGILPLDIVVQTGRRNGATNPTTLAQIEELQDYLKTRPELSKPLSIVELIKFAKQAFYRGNPDMYALPNPHERNFIFSYLGRDSSVNQNIMSTVLDSLNESARISVQMENLSTNEIQELKEDIEPVIDSIFDAEKTKVYMTGASLVFLEGSGYLIKNLLTSLVFAIIIISFLMALLFNHPRMVIISLLPNLFPQILTAALMGYLGVHIKPSTILVFSIALGISVDNSIHFLAKFRQELELHNNNIKHAVLSSLRESGMSMLYTFVVLFFGFIIFTASSFGGTQALGYLIAFTLLVALMSNLFLMPSILLSLHKRLNIKNDDYPNANGAGSKGLIKMDEEPELSNDADQYTVEQRIERINL